MTQPARTRVLIVDDHAAVRDGLAAFLIAFEDLTLVAQAASGVEALYLCSYFLPDIVLMNLIMKDGLDSVTVIRLIREWYEDVQVIVLTSTDDKKLMNAARTAGAVRILHKDISASELVTAIRLTQTEVLRVRTENAH